ncbi:hypothetical protein ABID30_003563 [Enterococcus rotai]|uniref:hypothetical protein n=1 Tax=Enterococcus rotai TaxID=118060 RepID=UPI000A9FC0FD|nr:hypothetical protein [Enterococcus rotai]
MLNSQKTEVTVSRKVNVGQKNSPTGSARADDENSTRRLQGALLHSLNAQIPKV